MHGTTHERVDSRWENEKLHLQPISGRLPYPYVEEELRKVARDAYVSWESNRYSVPWAYAGASVWVRGRDNQIEVHYGGEKIAVHPRASGKHRITVSTGSSRCRNIIMESHWVFLKDVWRF